LSVTHYLNGPSFAVKCRSLVYQVLWVRKIFQAEIGSTFSYLKASLRTHYTRTQTHTHTNTHTQTHTTHYILALLPLTFSKTNFFMPTSWFYIPPLFQRKRNFFFLFLWNRTPIRWKVDLEDKVNCILIILLFWAQSYKTFRGLFRRLAQSSEWS